MAVAQGYGKTVTSGSVFAYDTGDTRNSYRGEPTVNGVGNLNSYNPLDLYTWAPNGNTSTWSRDTSAPLSPVKGIPLKEISSGTDSYSDTYNGSADNIIAASSGQTWTVSVYALAAAGTNIQVWIFGANSSGNYIELDYNGFTATGVWQRISVTMTFSNGSTAYIQARVATSTNGGVIWWDGLQVEQKSYPTQFVNGTRSATQGLLPIVGNSTIDLTNVSFDSNAQMTFDGTNDYINIPSSNVFDTQTVTVEVIVKPYSTSQNGFWFEKGAVNTQYSLFMEGSNIQWRTAFGGTYNSLLFGSSNMTANAWNHVVGTYTAGDKRVYLNSTLMNSNNLNVTLNTNQGNQYIGSYNSNGYFYNGEIAVVKIYNRVLSAGEVRQNYLHYKTRFNLS
jgi:hypothetical protein